MSISSARHRYVERTGDLSQEGTRGHSAHFLNSIVTGNWRTRTAQKADTAATYEILKAQLDRYTDLENDIDKLSSFSAFNNNADLAGRIVFNEQGLEVAANFGKHKGKPVEQVFREEPSYYSWMMNGDFPQYQAGDNCHQGPLLRKSMILSGKIFRMNLCK